MKKFTAGAGTLILAFLLSGCASMTTYAKPDAPWASIRRIGVLTFSTPSENPVHRTVVTQLFTQELRRQLFSDVVEIPLGSAETPAFKSLASLYQVDAVFAGSVDESEIATIHVRLVDCATEELLWSSAYLVGRFAEVFPFRTVHQQFHRAFRKMIRDFALRRGFVPPS
jgi:hypothetical protein